MVWLANGSTLELGSNMRNVIEIVSERLSVHCCMQVVWMTIYFFTSLCSLWNRCETPPLADNHHCIVHIVHCDVEMMH